MNFEKLFIMTREWLLMVFSDMQLNESQKNHQLIKFYINFMTRVNNKIEDEYANFLEDNLQEIQNASEDELKTRLSKIPIRTNPEIEIIKIITLKETLTSLFSSIEKILEGDHEHDLLRNYYDLLMYFPNDSTKNK